jgi:hypothetical protein
MFFFKEEHASIPPAFCSYCRSKNMLLLSSERHPFDRGEGTFFRMLSPERHPLGIAGIASQWSPL